ncbi:hypothetical protein PV326_004918 [Microctonus aethiopoides]|nr:hypothetical protein PV326_004918 [Microctonus aethiopoides]
MTFTHTWKRTEQSDQPLTLVRSISSKIIPHVHLDSEPSQLSIEVFNRLVEIGIGRLHKTSALCNENRENDDDDDDNDNDDDICEW